MQKLQQKGLLALVLITLLLYVCLYSLNAKVDAPPIMTEANFAVGSPQGIDPIPSKKGAVVMEVTEVKIRSDGEEKMQLYNQIPTKNEPVDARASMPLNSSKPSKSTTQVIHQSQNAHQAYLHNAQEVTCTNFFPGSKMTTAINRCYQPAFPMFVHAIPDYVSDSFKSKGCFEKSILDKIIKQLGRNTSKLFLDCGANIGTFTTTIGSLGHEVIAVEPFNLNIPLVQKTICTNNMNVRLFKVGLADKSPGKKMCMWSTNTQVNNGNARMTPYFEGKKDWGEDKQKSCMEVIYSFTLDEVLFEIFHLTKRVNVMKIDIEGYETRAFRGAARLLTSPFKPCYIHFEYQRAPTVDSGVPEFELFETLLKYGYNITSVRKPHLGNLQPPQWGSIAIGDFMASLSIDGC